MVNKIFELLIFWSYCIVCRGPHTYWIKNGTVSSNADGYVNTIHYEDAARAALATLIKGVAGKCYVVWYVMFFTECVVWVAGKCYVMWYVLFLPCV